MIMNIYINVENTKLLAQEPNKSGLINQLLTEHYKKINRLPDGKITLESTPPGPNPFTKLTTDKVSAPIRPDIKQCPHGFAIGMCKKADCNRKYKK